jgi:putative membrane protein
MVPVLAQMMDRGDMHGDGWGWAGIVGLAFMVALVVLAVVLIVRLTSQPDQRPSAEPSPRSAEDLLAERLARGEIDTEEYRQRRDALRSG